LAVALVARSAVTCVAPPKLLLVAKTERGRMKPSRKLSAKAVLASLSVFVFGFFEDFVEFFCEF